MNPGIFAFPKKNWQRTAPSAVPIATTMTGPVGGGEGWRVVLLTGEDTAPLTRTLLLGLGEELTRRRLVAVLDPAPERHDRPEPLPLGADVVLRVRATGTLPSSPGGSGTFAATIAIDPVRPPGDHPAARWLPSLAATAHGTCDLQGSVADAAVGDWPHWFSGLGHALAVQVCERLGVSTLDDGAAATHITSSLWSDPAPGSLSVATSRIPSPPQGDVVDHLAPFQFPLVRGWIGRINPIPLGTRDGGTKDPVAALRQRLDKGEWRPQPTPDGFLALFSKEDNGQTRFISLRQLQNRTELVQWQERPQAASIYQTWRARAATGDATAQALVQAHRHTVGIPESLRSVP